MSTQQLPAQVGSHSDEVPLLSLELTSHDTVVIIGISGELDMSSAPVLMDQVKAVVASRPAEVVVDMAKVTFLCAAGLRALIQARDMIVAAGGHVVLRAPSRPTQQILTLTGTDCLFPRSGDTP